MVARRKKKVIHVNQHVIKANRRDGAGAPVLTVKTGAENHYAHEIEIKGECRIVYSPDNPLPCGAVCWIETTSDVVLIERRITRL